MIKTFKTFEKFNSNFWNWFGNSKMIDKDGNPIIAYHGTNRKFDEFKDDVGRAHDLGYYGNGFYFTFGNGKYSKDEARYYGNKIIEVYLKIENPFDFSKLLTYKNKEINTLGLSSMVFLYNVAKEFPELGDKIHINSSPINVLPKLVEKYKKKLKYTEGENNRGDKYKSGYVKSEIIHYDNTEYGGKKGSYLDYDELGRWIYNVSNDELEIGLIMDAIEKYDGLNAEYHPEGYMTRYPEITELIKKRGYDGIVQSMEGDEVVVFNPNQIKSVKNNGNYSLNSNNINEKNKNYSYNITELNDAIVFNQYSKFLDILKNVSDKINTIDNPQQEWTPLIYAVQNNRLRMIKKLIKNGANVNHKTHFGNTALMIAITGSDNEIINILLPITKWSITNRDNKDFFDYIKDENDKQKIIEKYPKKYKEYLIDKQSQKYNI